MIHCNEEIGNEIIEQLEEIVFDGNEDAKDQILQLYKFYSTVLGVENQRQLVKILRKSLEIVYANESTDFNIFDGNNEERMEININIRNSQVEIFRIKRKIVTYQRLYHQIGNDKFAMKQKIDNNALIKNLMRINGDVDKRLFTLQNHLYYLLGILNFEAKIRKIESHSSS